MFSLLGPTTFEDQLGSPTINYTFVGARVAPALPVVTWPLNGPAVATLNAAPVRIPGDHHGEITTHFSYNVTPFATGRAAMTVTPPPGYKISAVHGGADDLSSVPPTVSPLVLSTDVNGKNYVLVWQSTLEQFFNFAVTYRPVHS